MCVAVVEYGHIRVQKKNPNFDVLILTGCTFPVLNVHSTTFWK